MPYTINDIIIENEKDQTRLDYLIEIKGKSGIEYLMNHYFSGGTRPYISNILKYAKIEIPDHIFNGRKLATLEERQAHLNELRNKLKVKK